VTEDVPHRARLLLWAIAAVCGVALLGGVIGIWWWWGVGFDEAEAIGSARPSTDAAMVTSFRIALVGLAGLGLTGVVAAVRGRRQSP
jgi:ABC-type Fe3+ transport system permease subunit